MDNFGAHHTWARFLIERDRPADALRQLDGARRAERVSALVCAWRAYAFFFNGQRDGALEESDRPSGPMWMIGAAGGAGAPP